MNFQNSKYLIITKNHILLHIFRNIVQHRETYKNTLTILRIKFSQKLP